MNINLKLLLLECWFFLCATEFSPSSFHIYLVFLPPAILSYTALGYSPDSSFLRCTDASFSCSINNSIRNVAEFSEFLPKYFIFSYTVSTWGRQLRCKYIIQFKILGLTDTNIYFYQKP